MPGSLNKTAVTAPCSTFGVYTSVDSCRTVRPENHLAATAIVNSVCVDTGILAHIGCMGILKVCVLTLVVSAHQYGAAAGCAGYVYAALFNKANLLTKQLHRTADLNTRFSLNCP